LAEGAEGLLDVFKKPVEGAKEGGVFGFATGLVKGAAGSIVKPMAAIGTAVGELGTGIAGTGNVLNDNAASQRRRERERCRLPRLLFGELGEVRQYHEWHATVQMVYGRSAVQGVCVAIPLEKELLHSGESAMLLLFSDRLAVTASKSGWHEKFDGITGTTKQQGPRDNHPPSLRGIFFSQLKDISSDSSQLHLRDGKVERTVPLDKSLIGTEGLQALVDGLRSAASDSGQGHGVWQKLRQLLAEATRQHRQEADSSLVVEAAKSTASKGAAKTVVLEVWEVERAKAFGGGWSHATWVTEGDLTWRWVDERGHKHPKMDPHLKKEDAVLYQEPPCALGGLFKPAGPWQPGEWGYGMAWAQPTFKPKPGFTDNMRRRKWTREYV